MEGALAIRVYEKEHSLATLLEASKQLDSNVNHLIAVPMSERKIPVEYSDGNNMLRERLFNIHEMSRCLSYIDRQAIKERKREYTVIYQVN